MPTTTKQVTNGGNVTNNHYIRKRGHTTGKAKKKFGVVAGRKRNHWVVVCYNTYRTHLLITTTATTATKATTTTTTTAKAENHYLEHPLVQQTKHMALRATH